MIDGVTILNEYFVIGNYWFLIPLTVVILLIVARLSDPDESILYFLPLLFAILILLLTGSVAFEPRYESLVSDDVKFVDLMEEYSVKKRKGDIWVLEPLKDEDDNEEDI